MEGVVLRKGGDAIALLAPQLTGLAREHLIVAFVDHDQRVLRLSEPEVGCCASIRLPVRAIVRTALDCDAAGLIIAHNHPSGDPTPSGADRAATRLLADTLRALRVRIVDHLVFADDRWESFRALGLL